MPLEDRNAARLAGAAVIGLVLCAFALRLPHLSEKPIHVDEVYSYFAAQGVLHQGVSVFPATDYPYGRAVLHQGVVAAAMGLFGESLWTARAVSLAASLLSLVLVYAISRHWCGRIGALAVTAVVAFSRWEALHATSARMYALFQLAFLAAAWFALRAIDRPRRPGAWVGLALSLLAAAGMHQLALAALPGLFVGLVLALHGRLSPWRAAALGAAVVLAALVGIRLESFAPEAAFERPSYGTWGLDPLRFTNVGLTFFQFLNERAPVLPWLALLALPYGLARGQPKLVFGWWLAVGAGAATTAAQGVQSPRYYLHLFPIFVALGIAVLEWLVRDLRARRDVLGDLAASLASLYARLRARIGLLPRVDYALPLAGALAVAAGLALDRLRGQPFDPGFDQLVLIGAGVALLAAPLVLHHWHRIAARVNLLLLVVVTLGFLIRIPAWSEALGPLRYPPFQKEVFSLLDQRLRPGDRLLTTEQLAATLRFPSVEVGSLSQYAPDGIFRPYPVPRDLVSGAPFVDGPEKLEAWLSGPRRTFVLVDYRFEIHIAPELRMRVEALPELYRSDAAKLEGIPPDAEWAGQTWEYRLFLYDGSHR